MEIGDILICGSCARLVTLLEVPTPFLACPCTGVGRPDPFRQLLTAEKILVEEITQLKDHAELLKRALKKRGLMIEDLFDEVEENLG